MNEVQLNQKVLDKLESIFPGAKMIKNKQLISGGEIRITKPGIRLEIIYGSFPSWSRIWTRTPAGGMKQRFDLGTTHCGGIGGVASLLEEAKRQQRLFNEFRPMLVTSHAEEGLKRLPFVTQPEFKVKDTASWTQVSREMPQIMAVFNVNLVSIKKDDRKLHRLTCQETPKDHEIVYLVECNNSLGATFDIVTDAKTYYIPCNRYRGRLTGNLTPKKSVNLSSLTQGDLELVKFALEKLQLKFERGDE